MDASKRLPTALWIWLASLAGCSAAVALSFVSVDVPVARYFFPISHRLSMLGEGFGTAVVLSIETAMVLIIVVVRLVRGQIPPWVKVLAVACLASICAHGINSSVLKVFFGVPNPRAVVMRGAKHAFHFWMGSVDSSFPSGHMMLAGAFAGVFMRLYRASIAPFAVLLLIAACLLIVGGWHFVSDVIAGTFLGVSAGLLAGEIWRAHSSRRGA